MIDYSKIARAIDFYKSQGFLIREVPWVVPVDIMNITMPRTAKEINSDIGPLVGSAEQSFLFLIASGEMKAGKYVACTPCFRNDVVDNLHQKYFMKVELITTEDVCESRLMETVDLCRFFFERFLPTEIIKTDRSQFDIVSRDTKIELGSYGIRSHQRTGPWIYATGCAEPRLSYVLKLENRNF